MKVLLGMISWTGLIVCTAVACHTKETVTLNLEERVGKALFFDAALSRPAGQACATCHRPEKGFADTLSRPASEGAVKGLFSLRHSMTVSYAAFVPPLSYDKTDSVWVGGLFWDGRVNTLEEQAGEPFLNPLEMSAEQEWVVNQVRKAAYFPDLIKLYGKSDRVDSLYLFVSKALAAYERSVEINPFSSKFDAFVEGHEQLDASEQRGYELFKDKGMCAECHILEPDVRAGKILFTDHTYDNLGIPADTANPFYQLSAPYNPNGRDTLDLGLGGFLGDSLENGKFRVPTLRNIALTAPYGHNGYFRTLEDIIHFYNVRDVSSEYPPAEYPATVNREELGDLKLSPEEEADLVAFLRTLSDR